MTRLGGFSSTCAIGVVRVATVTRLSLSVTGDSYFGCSRGFLKHEIDPHNDTAVKYC